MRVVPPALCVVVLSIAASASAQSSSGHDAGVDPRVDLGGLWGARAAAPLRLSLESILPSLRSFPNCTSREDDAGNSVGGIPVQHELSVRLMPRLSLTAFTQLGCPIDAGGGAVLTYTAPIGPSSWLVLAGGAYEAPAQVPLFGGFAPTITRAVQGDASPVGVAVRADAVWKAGADRTLNLGVESRGTGRQTILFGGGF